MIFENLYLPAGLFEFYDHIELLIHCELLIYRNSSFKKSQNESSKLAARILMKVIQRNAEDFEVGEPLGYNRHSYLSTDIHTGDKMVVKILQFQNKNSRMEAIRQIQKYEFLDYAKAPNDENAANQSSQSLSTGNKP